MTLRECYETVGGSYDRVVERLGSAALVDKYIRRVPGDRSYQMLLDAMAAHRDEEAFRAAHTLKGSRADAGGGRSAAESDGGL